jgi:hypothetical protein
MSSSLSALLSATFYEPGYEHLVELVHQRDPETRRRLLSLDLSAFAAQQLRPLRLSPRTAGRAIFGDAGQSRTLRFRRAQVFAYYGAERVERTIALGPRAHAEVALAPEHGGQLLTRVETKSLRRGPGPSRRTPSFSATAPC